ncbi:VOC family protein [Ktedonobacter racemifer]|uniref:VOC family protein n=1 Tax=Ktedonobacter racemifer TaxID=363277 RepID=UPI000A01AA45
MRPVCSSFFTATTVNGRSFSCEPLPIRVPDCSAAYEILRSRGAEFIAPPTHYSDETRAFFHDPDGHLLEIWEAGETEARNG